MKPWDFDGQANFVPSGELGPIETKSEPKEQAYQLQGTGRLREGKRWFCFCLRHTAFSRQIEDKKTTRARPAYNQPPAIIFLDGKRTSMAFAVLAGDGGLASC